VGYAKRGIMGSVIVCLRMRRLWRTHVRAERAHGHTRITLRHTRITQILGHPETSRRTKTMHKLSICGVATCMYTSIYRSHETHSKAGIRCIISLTSFIDALTSLSQATISALNARRYAQTHTHTHTHTKLLAHSWINGRYPSRMYMHVGWKSEHAQNNDFMIKFTLKLKTNFSEHICTNVHATECFILHTHHTHARPHTHTHTRTHITCLHLMHALQRPDSVACEQSSHLMQHAVRAERASEAQ
jgi:hypothetical protein